MLEAYRKHVAERAEEGVVPKPLSAEQVADLIELLKQPPAGEEEFLLDLISNRVPPGVDEAAYVKAGFLSAIAKGEASSPLIDSKHAVELLGTMLGGYNISTLVGLLEDEELGAEAAKQLSHTLLMLMPSTMSLKRLTMVMSMRNKCCKAGPTVNGLPSNPNCHRS